MKRYFDPQKTKALAIDLDGTTLLPDGILGIRTRDCLRELLSRGKRIIISTGRAIESTERYINEIEVRGPMVFFNGAEVADVPSYKMLYTNLISLDVADFGAAIANDLGIHYQIYLPAGFSPKTGKKDTSQIRETLIINRDGPEAEYYFKHTGVTPIIMDMKTISALPLEGCVKGMYIADPSLHDEIRRRMNERFGDRINITRSYPTFLEVLNAGVSKGEGLKFIMKHIGLKPEEVIAFGDEENDTPMFPVAGFACAPQNARDKIKEAADFVYGPNTEEGLAVYLEKTFL
jgi:hypothetical protein